MLLFSFLEKHWTESFYFVQLCIIKKLFLKKLATFVTQEMGGFCSWEKQIITLLFPIFCAKGAIMNFCVASQETVYSLCLFDCLC